MDIAHPFLRLIRDEVFRIGRFNVSVDHMGSVLGSEPGSERFDDDLLEFCELAGLQFTPVDEHFEFKPAKVKK